MKKITKSQINNDIIVIRHKGNVKPYYEYEYIIDASHTYEVDENSACFENFDNIIYICQINNKKEFVNFLYEKLNKKD